jgi:solute:Na+ symporter, SSS family
LQIDTIDLVIVIGYLLGITAIGIVCSRRQAESSTGYFLAGRSLGWVTVGLALFATNISTVHMIGLASSGYGEGMVMGNFEWMAAACLILLGLVFAPFYFRSRVATLPEFIEKRFGPGARTFLAFMAVVGALFIHIGVTLYAGAVMFQSFVDIDIVYSILIVSLLTVIYTVTGGLKAVVVTESIQTVLLLVGAVAVTGFGVARLADEGITSLDDLHRSVLERQAEEAGTKAEAAALTEASQSEDPYAAKLGMVRTDGDFAWWIMLLGYPVLGIWYWCSDQTIVQRVLGARTERDAQIGPIFAGFIKVLPVLVMVLPGCIGYVLFGDLIGDKPDSTLIVLIRELLPAGIKGLVIAGLLAALMSTVAGALNSTSTLVSLDIVKRLRPGTPDRTLVRIGQITAVVVMVAAMAWSTQGERFGGIFKGIIAMIAVLAPPISTVFIWGVFWRRGTAPAALATLVVGFLLGAAAFVADFPAFKIEFISKDLGIPVMLQAWWLFVICSALFVAVSLATPAPEPEQVERYCWSNPIAAITGRPLSGLSDPRILSLILVAVMTVLYVIFA